MDTQAIGSTSGPAATAQTPARTQAAPAEAADAAKHEPVKHTTAPAADDVRTRDPRSLQYQVDKGTQQVVATIVDDSNRLVIRQIPDAEILRIAQAIDRMKGFLLEGKA